MIRRPLRWRSAIAVSAFSLAIATGCTHSTPSPQKLASIDERVSLLQANLERVEAIRAVKRVQRSYGHYSELGLWHDLAELFSDQAIGNYPAGVLVGREKIRDLFYKDVGQNVLGLADGRLYPHIVLSPVVTLSEDGQTAKGRWRILAMLGGYGRSASWAGGSYENQYVKENGIWKISHLSFFSQYGGRYAEGLKPAASGPTHFNAALASAPIANVRQAQPVGAAADFMTLARRVGEIERRAQVLSDEAEVTNLQHAYAYHFDRKQWRELAALFVADGTLEMGQRGVYAGRERIRGALSFFNGESVRDGEVHDHLEMQALVTIAPDGLSAKARSTQVSMTGIRGEHAEWGEGISENEFVKENGAWKIRAVHFYPRVVTDYKEGWAKSALPTPGPSAEFPPDRPPTERYEVYPKFFIPPFHFLHPVTGKPAQYPQGTPVPTDTPLAVRPVAGAAPPATIAALESRLAKAELALARAAAFDAAQNLVDAYGHFLDERMWGEVGALFTPRGSHQLPDVAEAIGPERVRQSLEAKFGPPTKVAGFLAIHKIAQPVITVAADGKSARVRSRLFEIDTWTEGDDTLIAGEYASELVNENGAWRFESMSLDYIWKASYREGWTSTAAPRSR
jgi:hypothetical protein